MKYTIYKEDKEKTLHLVDHEYGSVFIIDDWLNRFKDYIEEIQDINEKHIITFFEDYITNNLSDYESYELEGFLFKNYLKDKLIEIDLNELKQDIYL